MGGGVVATCQLKKIFFFFKNPNLSTAASNAVADETEAAGADDASVQGKAKGKNKNKNQAKAEPAAPGVLGGAVKKERWAPGCAGVKGRGEPAQLPEVAVVLAWARGAEPAEIARATADNTQRLFWPAGHA
jgi:Tat protein secretion system quality control protein TatD with DNase activity